eukprot:8824821-Pyramimonas_sp.AAC.1
MPAVPPGIVAGWTGAAARYNGTFTTGTMAPRPDVAGQGALLKARVLNRAAGSWGTTAGLQTV